MYLIDFSFFFYRIQIETKTKRSPIRYRCGRPYTRRRKAKQKHNTICVVHHMYYTPTNTNNVNKTWALLHTTGCRTEHRFYVDIVTGLSKRNSKYQSLSPSLRFQLSGDKKLKCFTKHPSTWRRNRHPGDEIVRSLTPQHMKWITNKHDRNKFRIPLEYA
jgi:hypothetical protein